jgi:hypothetical protein
MARYFFHYAQLRVNLRLYNFKTTTFPDINIVHETVIRLFELCDLYHPSEELVNLKRINIPKFLC